MEKTILWQGLSSLSNREQKQFRKFVRSPYFNQRQDLILLNDYLLDCIFELKWVPTPEKVYSQLQSMDTYDNQQLRLIMSYLTRLFEQFLIFEKIDKTNRDLLIDQLNSRKLIKHLKFKIRSNTK